MSFIDYEVLSDVVDKRMIKSRRAIFKGLIDLLSEKPIEKIKVSELCLRASINRNTFYNQFTSVQEAFKCMEVNIIETFLRMLLDTSILSYGSFRPSGFILFLDKVRRENQKEFDIIYPTLRNTMFLRLLGAQLESMGRNYHEETRSIGEAYPGHYMSALIFSITGLTNMYFDWFDDGMAVPIQDLAALAEQLLNVSLDRRVNSEPES